MIGILHRGVALVLLLALGACASKPYSPSDLSAASFLQRSLQQQSGPILVEVAVPGRAETKALTGLDLYKQDIQPIWVKVTNNSKVMARVSHWSIDRHYYPPIEVAYMNRKPYSKEAYSSMERWFYETGLPRRIPPGETRAGLVYTTLTPGTKGFNFDIFSAQKAYNFTFFVPIPGFTPDYIDVDFDSLYPSEELVSTDVAGLQKLLESSTAPMYPTNAQGDGLGTPLNIAIVANRKALRRSLLRARWRETTDDDPSTEFSRQQRLWNRPPDGIFYLSRADGNERISMGLWLSPWQVDGEPVWLGQLTYGVDDRRIVAQFLNPHGIAADIDNPQRFAMQVFWYSQSLRAVGYVSGIDPAPRDKPRSTFYGREYFTDGRRLVVYLSEEPVAMGDGEIVYGRDMMRRITGGND
ncbi:MAG: hypothetical protein ABJK25_06070 [Halieaceae bacterium]